MEKEGRTSISFLCFLRMALRLSFCAAVSISFCGVHSVSVKTMVCSVSSALRCDFLPTALSALRTASWISSLWHSSCRSPETPSEEASCFKFASCGKMT